MNSDSKPQVFIRRYQKSDRDGLRKLCADTGFLGKPIDPIFEDRGLFADFLTKYYTDWEPESAWVCEAEGELQGYLIGCRKPRLKFIFHLFYFPVLLIRGFWRYVMTPYGANTKKYIRWILKKSRKEAPYTPPRMPHFHINLLPQARNVSRTKELIESFLIYLKECGEESVYGQMVTFEERRGKRMFARYGFDVVDIKEVSKYRDYYDGSVFLFTVVRKNLQTSAELYGSDLQKK